MRLTKLEMHGFKSFADSTTMAFEPGVTAIVGPNGCGKSNVSDAVRWVLGEQRARILRGAKMEEVIFQGSSARRPVNVAEVSLHFENDEGDLNVAFREVVITRRLSRSGESDYLLNGAVCRLRDIHDLLRGTGLGADAGVVIESKMIDALLSDRPDERRELFEEAAGVSLYRDRRRSTERRLEETTTDLARLDDLLNEVQSQVRSLARQRKKAERHEELRTRRFAVELTLAGREMEAWQEELTQLEQRLTSLRETAPAAESAVSAAEEARNSAHEQRTVADNTRSEVARLVQSQAQSVQERRSEIAVASERQKNAAARKQRAEEERLESAAVGERLAQEREQADANRTAAHTELATAREQLREVSLAEEGTRANLVQRRSVLDQAERELRDMKDRIRRLELDREGAQREIGDVDQRITQLEGERTHLVDAVSAVARETATADEQIALSSQAAQAAAVALEDARLAAKAARDADAEARAGLARASDLVTSLEGKVNALEGLERERVGLAPAAARLLRDREQFPDGAILGPLSDFISSSSDTAATLERFLGMTVHAVVVRDHAAADAVRTWHSQNNPGPLLLLPLDQVAEGEIGESDLLPLVEAQPVARRWVNALLGRVRTIGDGAGFVDARGAIWLPGTAGGPGPLRRRAELFGLRAELQAVQDSRVAAEATSLAAREALETAQAQVAAASESASTADQEVRRANEWRAEVERRRVRASRELDEADALVGRLRARREELVQRIARYESDTATISTSLGAHETTLEGHRTTVGEAEHALESAREARASAQVTLAQAEARVQVANETVVRLQREFDGASARLASLQDELNTLLASDRELADQLAAWQADLDERIALLTEVEQRYVDAEQAVRQADQSLTDAESQLSHARREAHDRESSLHTSELRFIELSGKRATIRERLETEWRKPLEDLLSNFEAVDATDEDLRVEAEGLRAEVERLGPINPLAIEEHEEELKRLDFLTQQRNDLNEGKNKLQLAIREIDTTARDLFLNTFTQVRENFRQIFMTLFGGGECDLRLENPELPLDCDIEVHASPRGKKTQRIHLLSSGERALVALSLLFGIFLTKPSPFCLLDEVDAPLDDANIGRFVRMLNQFKDRTQFIVITHNPRTTTEAADAVYGVTMQDPGVSSLVSVRMRGATFNEGEAEAAVTVNA